MEARFCSSCKKPNPNHVIYCYHCGVYIDQQPPELRPRISPELQPILHPSPFSTRSPFDQPVIQQTTTQVLRCAECRLLNYSGEETCKRCGGMLVDRNFSGTRHQQNQSASIDPSSAPSDPWFTITEAEKKIRYAWVAGVISASLTTILVLGHGMVSRATEGVKYTALAALITFLLSYGIYKKSCTCAILLCGLFALDKLLYFMAGGNITALPVALIFLYFYARGIEGTYEYYKHTAHDPKPAYSDPSGQQRTY